MLVSCFFVWINTIVGICCLVLWFAAEFGWILQMGGFGLGCCLGFWLFKVYSAGLARVLWVFG